MRWIGKEPPGDDECTLARTTNGWELRGRARFTRGKMETLLSYGVKCDRAFRTSKAWVNGTIGGRSVVRRIVAKDGRWFLDGKARPSVEGCVDIDLAFTPATNLLPIRRLRLAIGQSASVEAAWFRFPQFDLRRLPQTYRRVDRNTYEYRSGRFEAVLKVDRRGFVTDYGGLWTRLDERSP